MNEQFQSIMQGLQEVLEFEQGTGDAYVSTYSVSEVGETVRTRQFIQPPKDFSKEEIKSIRLKSGLTQNLFANCMGVSRKTVESWEYGKNKPNGSARRLLALMENGDKVIA